MNRDEILAKSRNENKHSIDERESAILSKALNTSQAVGCALCVLLMIVNDIFGGPRAVSVAAMTIFWGTFTVERIMMAVMTKSKARWILSAFAIIMLVVHGIAFLIMTIRGGN